MMARGFQRVRSQANPSLQEGSVVGGYVLVALLASGITSELWLARALGADDAAPSLALKVTHEHLSSDIEFIRRFRLGAEVQARLEHAGIPRTLNIGLDHGRCFVVSDFVPGRSLRQILHRGANLGRVPPVWFSLAVLASACEILDYADRALSELGSALPWASRGVRPEHILVSMAGETRMAELLLPSARDSIETQSRRGGGLWDVYVAPELSRGEADTLASPRADVYSVGLILYEMITGERPEPTVLRALERPSKKSPWAGSLLDDVVARATQQDPNLRYRNVLELGGVLGRCLSQLGVQPSAKHIAQQVCGLISHPDCEPPPSARLGGPVGASSQQFPASGTRWAAEARAPLPEDWGSDRPRRVPSGTRPSAESWDAVVARARPEPSGVHAESAAELFDLGLQHLRNRDYVAALEALGRAVELQPNNRVYLANLRKLRKQLGGE